MKFLSTFEAAEKWGISHRRVSVLCNQGRITGAQRAGSRWIIPENAEKPSDARIRSGKYIKKPRQLVVLFFGLPTKIFEIGGRPIIGYSPGNF